MENNSRFSNFSSSLSVQFVKETSRYISKVSYLLPNDTSL